MDDWRAPVGFLVAPLAVPLLMTWTMGPSSDSLGEMLVIVIGAGFTYIFSLLFGVPTYLFLRARQLTEFWVAPVAGAMIALVTWHLLLTLFVLSVAPVSALPSLLGGPGMARPAMFFMLSGAVVGAIFWLIARPDRVSGRTSPEEQN
jgi:hypothetical protein